MSLRSDELSPAKALPVNGRSAQAEPEPAGWPRRLRPVDPLVLEISGDKIVISSPRLPRRLRVGPAVAQILISARSGRQPAGHPRTAIATLVKAGFLVETEPEPEPDTDTGGDTDTDTQAGTETSAPPWDAWGITAWAFHTRIRDTTFVGSDPVQISAYRDRLAGRPRPASVRSPVSDRILLLPRVRSPLSVPFRDVLEGRRTHRHFEDHALDLDAFSDLLHYTFAPLRFADAGQMGTLQLRASASGGARHETEAFVFVLNVASVRPGLYHYDNIRHGLEPIRADVGRAELEHLTNDQGFFKTASFGVLTAAVAERMSWKYPHPVAYRMLLQNVGHMAQVFAMTATALGLGASLTGAIRGSEADRMLGLHEPGEFTTFALACGLPVRGPGGLPKSIRLPAEAPDYY